MHSFDDTIKTLLETSVEQARKLQQIYKVAQ